METLTTYEPTVTKQTLFDITKLGVIVNSPLQILFAAATAYMVGPQPMNAAMLKTARLSWLI